MKTYLRLVEYSETAIPNNLRAIAEVEPIPGLVIKGFEFRILKDPRGEPVLRLIFPGENDGCGEWVESLRVAPDLRKAILRELHGKYQLAVFHAMTPPEDLPVPE